MDKVPPLPTEQECLDYFQQYAVPKNIFHHCLKVRDVSVFLAKQLQAKGLSVNIDFVNCLALFHDMFKVVTFKDLEAKNQFHHYVFSQAEKAMWKKLREKYSGKYEGEVASDILKDKYPELAFSLIRVSNPQIDNPSWEESILHYADWRVFQEKIIPLAERLAYFRKNYPRTDDAWDRYARKIKEQEERIFSHLDFPPEQLANELSKKAIARGLTK